MEQIRNILVAVDFSEASDWAAEYAAVLAARNGAHLHVVHVRVLSDDLYEEGLQDHERFQGALDRAAETRLYNTPRRVDVDVSRAALRGTSAAAEIVDYAADHAIDLVVVGTRGRTGLTHILLGSVAQAVVRLSPVSVLVVSHAEGSRPSDRAEFRDILCPVDFSDASKKAFDAALALAQRNGARLRALHVVDEIPYPSFYRTSPSPVADDPSRIRQRALKEMKKLHGDDGDVAVEPLVADGRAPRKIVEVAQEHRVDLIVMGSVGLSGMRRVLVGSVAEKVLRTAHCPVLIVKGEAAQLEM